MGYIEFVYYNNQNKKKKAKFRINDDDTLQMIVLEDYKNHEIVESSVPNITVPETKIKHGIGEIVASITKLFGFKPCAPCNKRRKYLNNKTPNWLVKIIERFYIGKTKNKK